MARYGLPNIDIAFTQKAVTAVQRLSLIHI